MREVGSEETRWIWDGDRTWKLVGNDRQAIGEKEKSTPGLKRMQFLEKEMAQSSWRTWAGPMGTGGDTGFQMWAVTFELNVHYRNPSSANPEIQTKDNFG